ncbi:MAG: hypothetical protein BGO98_42085 [Myxococcales bacterium 68-20]|nr:MAG: hypothetical protein BGO98_42085 [Myxococcales bacterium 68-20]
MAHLNVRERTIEIRIAYVGGERAGKQSTFSRLREAEGASAESFVDDGEKLALTMRASTSVAAPDCGMVVRLFGHRGEVRAQTARPLLHDADGVVVVVDADPAAAERNLRSVRAVRDLLEARTVPVVVQVNKVDMAAGTASNDIVRELGVDAWPNVPTSARSGEGVEATLNRVVDDVMQAMTQPKLESEEHEATRPKQADSNPLLTALRRILEATVEEHVGKMGERLGVRFEQRFEALEGRIDETTQQVTRFIENLDALNAGTIAYRRQALSNDAELLRAARHAHTREDLATTMGALRGEITRASEATLAAVKESGLVAKAHTERAANAIANDTRQVTTEGLLTPLTARLGELERRIDAVAEITRSLPATTARSATLGEALARDLQDALARSERVEALLVELTEELKKSKKSWFG